eukprot:TRINITY_DN1297_c1_g2_i1.p1 TRINITY_DN1297_c1_g2~~TRINITY_DN1297_c1_g2_i1.p1  ORF type:complete len:164 (+),score=23.38 TRINITY_DN1297_c1_g2_i1:48-494(+)
MALSSFPSVIVTTPVPKPSYQTRVRVSVSSVKRTLGGFQFNGNRNWTRLNAGGLTEIEPDLIEDKHDRWATNGVPPEDFLYGEYDGHHTYHEGNEGTFWEAVASEYAAAEPPSGFQGIISWLFLPAMVAGLAYHVQVILNVPYLDKMR